MKRTIAVLSLISFLGLGGCAQIQPLGTNQYSLQQANQAMSVEIGTVLSIKHVVIEGQDTGVGTAAGAVGGGFLGSRLGQGNGSILGAVVGAIAGGVAGHVIENKATNTPALQLTVGLDKTSQVIMVTEKTNQIFNIGDKVNVVGLGTNDVRVVHLN